MLDDAKCRKGKGSKVAPMRWRRSGDEDRYRHSTILTRVSPV